MVKGGLDLAISLMEKLNTESGSTAVQIGLVGAALTGIIGMAVKGGWADVFRGLGEPIKEFLMITSGHAIKGGLPVALGLTAAVAGTAALVKITDALVYDYEDATDKVKELVQAREEEFGQGSKYAELSAQQGQLNEYQKQELDYLQQKLDLQNQLIENAQKEAYDQWQKEHGTGREVTTPTGTMTMDESNFATLIGSVSNFQSAIESGQMSVDDFDGSFSEFLNLQTQGIEQLETFAEQGYQLSDAQQRQVDLVHALAEAYSSGESSVEKYGLAVYETWKAAGASSEDARTKAIEAMENFEEQQKIADEQGKQEIDAVEQAATAVTKKDYTIHYKVEPFEIPEPPVLHGQLIYTGSVGGVYTAKSTSGTGIPGSGYAGNAAGTDNFSGGPTLLNELGPELISANGRAWIAGGGKPTVTNLPKGAIVLTADETKEALKTSSMSKMFPAFATGRWNTSISNDGGTNYGSSYGSVIDRYTAPKPTAAEKARWEAMQNQANRWKQSQGGGGAGGSGGGGSGGGGSSGPSLEEIIKEQSKAFKDQLDILKDRLAIMEKEGKSEELRIDQIKKIQAEIERQKQWYYDHGEDANSKHIRDLEKQWLDYANKIKDLYKDQAGYYDMLFGAVSDKAQDEIDILEQQKKELQEQNSEARKRLELEKAYDDLARARQQKKLVLRNGEMVYAEDVDAVAKAQQRIDEIKNREAADKRIEEIDKKIEEWKKYQEQWSSVGSDYERAQDLAIIAKKLGIDLDKDDWMSQLDDIQTYIDKYNDLMVKGGAEKVELKARTATITGGGTGVASPASMWSMGAPTPASMMSAVAGGLGSLAKSTSITIQNFNPNLPGVTDGEGFVKYLRNNFLQQTLQFANG